MSEAKDGTVSVVTKDGLAIYCVRVGGVLRRALGKPTKGGFKLGGDDMKAVAAAWKRRTDFGSPFAMLCPHKTQMQIRAEE